MREEIKSLQDVYYLPRQENESEAEYARRTSRMAEQVRRRAIEQHVGQLRPLEGPLPWPRRAWRWLRRSFDGDHYEVDLDVLRQMDVLVEGCFTWLGTSRSVGPGIKQRLRERAKAYRELREKVVRG